MKMNIRNKMLLGFIAVLALTAIVGLIGLNSANSINDMLKSLYSNDLMPISHVADANQYLISFDRDLHAYIIASDKATMDQLAAQVDEDEKQMKALLDAYRQTELSDQDKVDLANFEATWPKYRAVANRVIESGYAGKDDEAVALINGEGTTILKEADDLLTNIVKSNEEDARQAYDDSEVIFAQARSLIIAGIIGAVLIGLFIAFFLSRGISNAAKLMAGVADGIAKGELEHQIKVKSQDEMGDMARSFSQMIVYLQNIAAVANKTAAGDLTETVTPISVRDVLGNAFTQMISSLRQQIGQVAQSASGLSAASQQLASAANQAGQASTQIASTMQQVAKGNSQQTESVTRTATSIEQMSHAIEGVAKGAQEQAAAISRTSAITSEINTAIQQVAGNAQAVSRDSAEAARSAEGGAKIVKDTIDGMQNIKVKVTLSSQKVQEMGQRSDEIGVIVETIEDIASQTNLLALNAAIEAARAGEHGKGFSVVADEVRKLAERASSATKEIGGLVKGIQRTVAEAVTAMDEGVKEVEIGVGRANSAGEALGSILKSAEAVYQQAEQAAAATEQMSASASELVSSVDSVSAVVEENTAATEQMAAGATSVTQLVESNASIGEENSAAVEEVSASTEELNAQVEEVSASAQTLSAMAMTLQSVVEQFKL